MTVLLLVVLPFLDIWLFTAWRGAKGAPKKVLAFLMIGLALPQAAFIVFILFRIALAFYTGEKL